jgi:hypothetical protein
VNLKKYLSDSSGAIRSALKDTADDIRSALVDSTVNLKKYLSDSSGAIRSALKDTADDIRSALVDSTNSLNLRKLNVSDTAVMLSNYLREIDTTNLSNRINLKVNISDTASMLGMLTLDRVLQNGNTTNLNIVSTSNISVANATVSAKIGIGTATPSYELDVIGKGRFTDSLIANTIKINSITSGSSTDSIVTIDSNGILKKRSITTVSGIQNSDEITASSGQISFTLSATPIGKVLMFKNGIRLPKSCYTLSGNTITYIPANNGNEAMDAGDRINFDY